MSAVTDPAQAAAIAAAIKEAAYYIKASQIMFCAFYAVCLWDWLTSLQREYRLIWKSPWSVIKVLYLLCRYWVLLIIPYVLWVFVEDHSEAACLKLFKSPVALAMWNQLWSEGVLLIRTYAFLGNKKSVLFPLLVGLAGVVAYQLYVDNTQMTLLPFLDPAGGPCFPTVKYVGSPHIMLFFVAPLVFDTLVTCLTLWRAWQIRNQSGGHGSPLLKTFVSEGIWYFLLISAANLINAIFYWQPKAVMSALLIPLSVMFPDILACRMILGLRERGVRHTSGANTSAHYSHSARKISNANQLNVASGAVVKTGNTPPTQSTGVVTNMDFNHELTTFSRTRAGDSESMIERDVKSVPYELDETVADRERARNGIRVDIESHRYYEERSDGESDDKKGRSFMS
ncbi:hypothetical protein FRC04_008921 [Tulasnella sp. 424]|nr:hypothetical protein FRC04_008921 [Tulasnella sp. 424]KAG8973820.1 hypothetical protein FRC05_008239 [Tulasnella sp. 425]